MEKALNYSYEDLKIIINGREVESKGYDIIEFKLNSEVNNHTKLMLKTRVKLKNKEEWDLLTEQSGSTSIPGEKELEFYLNERKYFAGIIQRGTTFIRDDGDLIVEMEIYSKSEIMDRDKNYRVYQNSKIKYIDIVKDILSRHEYITIVGVNRELYSEDTGINERLSQMMKSSITIQFDETDWEFLIRIMSHIGIGVFNSENGSMSLGLSKDVTVNKQWNIITGNVGRGIDKYDNIYYKLESQDFFLLGDNIVYEEKQNMGYVNRAEIECKEGKFYGKYFLRQFEYWFDYIPNTNIKGAKIDCRVMNVPTSGDKKGIALMTVNFTSGIGKLIGNKEKNRKRDGKNPVKLNAFNDWISYKGGDGYFSFPYSTFYSQTNTGFFCTPEVNDVVPVIFESDEECEGFVGFSIDNPGNSRFSNPFYRNYTTTEDGGCCFEFTVSKDNYMIECKNLYKEAFKDKIMVAEDTININCDNAINVENKNDIIITTKNNTLNVTGEANENIEGDKNFSSSNLKEQVSGAKSINSDVYEISTSVYITNK